MEQDVQCGSLRCRPPPEEAVIGVWSAVLRNHSTQLFHERPELPGVALLLLLWGWRTKEMETKLAYSYSDVSIINMETNITQSISGRILIMMKNMTSIISVTLSDQSKQYFTVWFLSVPQECSAAYVFYLKAEQMCWADQINNNSHMHLMSCNRGGKGEI